MTESTLNLFCNLVNLRHTPPNAKCTTILLTSCCQYGFHTFTAKHDTDGFPRHLPAKGSVGVDDTQWVEGGVHHLPGTQQVRHHRNTQAANQNPERNVHHTAYQHT